MKNFYADVGKFILRACEWALHETHRNTRPSHRRAMDPLLMLREATMANTAAELEGDSLSYNGQKYKIDTIVPFKRSAHRVYARP